MKGWYGDKQRHKLASKGVKTIRDSQGNYGLKEYNTEAPIISARLEVEQVIYVPSTNVLQETISGEEMRIRINEVRSVLSKLFGGYTSVEGIGGYLSDEFGLIEEPVVRIISYAEKESFRENSDDLIDFLEEKRKEWGQLSMGYEIEGDMYYLGETRWD